MTLRMCWPLALILAVVPLGCGPAISSTAFISPAPAPQPPEHPIRMYGESKPRCPYEEVGTVTALKRAFVSDERLSEALRRRAREMGGDAIINVGGGREVSGAILSGGVVSVAHRNSLSGTVIRFRDPSCTE